MTRETKSDDPVEPHELEALRTEPRSMFTAEAIFLFALFFAVMWCAAIAAADVVVYFLTGAK